MGQPKMVMRTPHVARGRFFYEKRLDVFHKIGCDRFVWLLLACSL